MPRIFFHNRIKKHTSHEQGFTLPELIISIAIMVIVMTLVLFNYRKFDSNIIITDLAYDVALSIRQAQSYGVSVRGFGDSTTFNTPFKYSYGIAFDQTANDKVYTLFADINANGQFDNVSEEVERYRLSGGYRIERLCLNSVNTSCPETDDNNAPNPNIVDDLTILFVRPEPDALFSTNGVQSILSLHATVVVRSPQKTERVILIRSTGEISVR